MAEQTLANARALASNSGFRANRAFIVESLVLLAFLALAVALVLQLFASAGITSRSAHAQSVAMQLAGNAAERFAADPLAPSDNLYYDDQGQLVSSDAPAAAFCVSLDVQPAAQPSGVLYQANVNVEPVNGGFLDNTYTLQTARYVPDAPAEGDAPAEEPAEDGGGAL